MFAGVTHQHHGFRGFGAIEEKDMAASRLGGPNEGRIYRFARHTRPAWLGGGTCCGCAHRVPVSKEALIRTKVAGAVGSPWSLHFMRTWNF